MNIQGKIGSNPNASGPNYNTSRKVWMDLCTCVNHVVLIGNLWCRLLILNFLTLSCHKLVQHCYAYCIVGLCILQQPLRSSDISSNKQTNPQKKMLLLRMQWTFQRFFTFKAEGLKKAAEFLNCIMHFMTQYCLERTISHGTNKHRQSFDE